MEIDNYVKPQAMFLKADDVASKPEELFHIVGEGKVIVSEKFGNERLHILGKFGDEEKTFDCSKTNARTISEKLGNDTIKWIGKSLKLETYKTKTSEGKLVDAINVAKVIV